MKKIILLSAILLMTLTGLTQNADYFKAMGESLGRFAQCKTSEDYQSLANQFNLIANAEEKEWLPLYYHAQCYIMMSFSETADAGMKDTYLDAAAISVQKMIAIAPSESEIFALQALMYSARLMVNPMERGQKFGALSEQAVAVSLRLDATNPRAKFIKLRGDMGKAQFFGKDPKEYCPAANELFQNWDQYKLRSPLHPAWGKSQVAEIVNECK